MRIVSRPAVLVATTLAVAVVGSPAFAATTTKAHPTTVTAQASKGTVAPKHKDTVNVVLRSGKASVAGEEGNFVVRSRRDVSKTAKWGAWTAVTAIAGMTKGHYTMTVTMPAKMTKGQKEQFEVKFTGDSANHLASSHSQVFTVRAS